MKNKTSLIIENQFYRVDLKDPKNKSKYYASN